MNITTIKTAVTPVLGVTKLWLKKNAPHIMFGIGIAGIPISTYLACKATLRLDEIKEEKEALIEKIDEGKKEFSEEEYTSDDYKRDLTIVGVQSAVKIVKLYLPAGGVMLASIALLTGGHFLLTGRVAALASAYKILDNSYKNYRGRVKEQFGEDFDDQLRLSHKEVVVEGETIKEANPGIAIARFDPDNEYIKIFAEDRTVNWSRDHERNLFFLQSQERYANDLLDGRGHLFYNEVLDMLGLQRTKAGAVVGWTKSRATEPTKRVSFGIFNAPEEIANDYPNGLSNPPFVLDFNVDGVIFDAI